MIVLNIFISFTIQTNIRKSSSSDISINIYIMVSKYKSRYLLRGHSANFLITHVVNMAITARFMSRQVEEENKPTIIRQKLA